MKNKYLFDKKIWFTTYLFLFMGLVSSRAQTPVQLIEFNDIAPSGTYWALPTEVDSKVFYQYKNTGSSNYYLYVTDGTSGGSSLLKTFNGPISSPHVINNNQYLFLADDDSDSRDEIWTSDGTIGGTVQLIEFSQTSGSGWPNLTVVFDKVFYQYNTSGGTLGYLYVTDGTQGGSSQVQAFNDMIETPHVFSYTQYLFWTDNDGDFMPELWTSDGTGGGTTQLFETQTIYATGAPGAGTEAGGKMFYRYLNSSYQGELYVTDGTSGGSSLLETSEKAMEHPHVLNDKFMYCTDDDYDVYGEIWTSDGTIGGTVQLFESTDLMFSGPPSPSVIVSGRVYYHYTLDGFDYQLLSSDGTSGGTIVLKTFAESFGNDHTINGNQFLFCADDDNDNRTEIWTSNGSVGGTIQLFEFSDFQGTFWPTYFEKNNRVYYHYSSSGGTPDYLASTDGTSGGTLQAMSSGDEIEIHHENHNFGDRYLFIADDDGDQRLEAWTSDGSINGTQEVFEFGAIAATNTPIISEVNGINYYQYENTGASSSDLYASDGTSSGSSNLGSFNGKINVPHSINGDQYLFIADDDQDGRQEVWSVSGLINLEEEKEQSTSMIYPVPANDQINLTSTIDLSNVNFVILDLTGKIIDNGVMKSANLNAISIENLPKGVYILKLDTGEGDQNIRFIKY